MKTRFLSVVIIGFLICSIGCATARASNSSDQGHPSSSIPVEYSFVFKNMDIIVSALVVLVSALTGINVWAGISHFRVTNKELSEFRRYAEDVKLSFDRLKVEYTNKINSLDQFAKDLESRISRNIYEVTKVSSYRLELYKLLNCDPIDVKTVYILLSKIIEFPSVENVRIYELCLSKVENKDVIKLVTKGLSNLSAYSPPDI